MAARAKARSKKPLCGVCKKRHAQPKRCKNKQARAWDEQAKRERAENLAAARKRSDPTRRPSAEHRWNDEHGVWEVPGKPEAWLRKPKKTDRPPWPGARWNASRKAWDLPSR